MAKITVAQMDAVLTVYELAFDQAQTIRHEVLNNVQGTMYNNDDIADAEHALEVVKELTDNFYNK